MPIHRLRGYPEELSSAAGRGREECRDQQEQVLGSSASLEEIDSLRRGQQRSAAGGVMVAPPGERLALPRFDDLACVSRAGDRAQVEVSAVTLRERLPCIAIPLREPDPDVVLDLPSIFARCYGKGAYAVRVDYDQPLFRSRRSVPNTRGSTPWPPE